MSEFGQLAAKITGGPCGRDKAVASFGREEMVLACSSTPGRSLGPGHLGSTVWLLALSNRPIRA
jgi:hypothetical protein